MTHTDTTQAAEATVIRVLLNDPEALIPIADVLPDARFFGTPRLAAVYRAIQELASQTIPPNPATVAEQLGVDLDQIQVLAGGYTRKAAREVIYSAESVARSGQRRLLLEALHEAVELTEMETTDIAGLAFTAMQMVAGASAELDNRRESDMAAVGKEMDARLYAAKQCSGLIGFQTHLPWLNDKTGGMAPGTIWVIAGAYKNRKTSLARNLVIDACRARGTVALFALEGSRVITYAGLLAMLATDRLLKWGMAEEAHLSDIFMFRGLRSEMQAAAIAEARAELDKFKLYLYDNRDGIARPERLAMLARRDKLLHGLNVMVVDYLQLLGSGRLFDRLEASTQIMQQLIGELEVCGILIAQLNESAIWQMRGDAADDNYSPGVKGGGDPAAAADFLFRTLVSQSDPADLQIELKLARLARPGKLTVRLNEQSGWIIR